MGAERGAPMPISSRQDRPRLARSVRCSLAVLAAALFGGCGFHPNQLPPTTGTGGTTSTTDGGATGGTTGTGGTGPKVGPTSLVLSPPSATMTVSNTGPAQTQQYTVMGTLNGQTQDVTSQATFSVYPPGAVTIDSSGLATSTGKGGGKVTVTAAIGNQTATANLIVYYTFTGADPGMANNIPGDPSSIFTTTANDMTRAPQLVYPNDGVLFPPNITGIEIHFLPGSTSNTLFEVSLAGQIVTVNAFVRCTAPSGINGCIYQPDPSLWQSVAVGNAGQGPVSLTVRGTDDTGTSVGNSSPFHMQFAQDNIDGALYYWTTSGKTAVMRWDFSGSTQSAQAYLTPTNTSIACVGCHALALDGSKMVVSSNGQGDGRLLLWDVTNNKALVPYPLTQRSQFESWNADGSQFVGVYGDAQSTSRPAKAGPVNLMIFDGKTGAVTTTIDLMGARGDHPDWTKNADTTNTIVFTSADPTAPTTDQRPATGGIGYVQYDGAAWGAPQTLVPSVLGKNRYYPAIAPDGNLVVYDESTCTAGTPTMGTAPDKSCDADTDATATMFITSLMNQGTPISLDNANRPGVADGTTTALTNSFPRWSPFIQKLSEQQNLMWLTFSSTRQYGLRAPPAPTSTDETKTGTLIWMVGINPGVGGADPSFTAFCLPFQDVTTSNHIAQWAKFFLQIPG